MLNIISDTEEEDEFYDEKGKINFNYNQKKKKIMILKKVISEDAILLEMRTLANYLNKKDSSLYYLLSK